MSRRVVVTGVGLFTPLGTNSFSFWKSLTSGQSGITELPTGFLHPAAKVSGQIAHNVFKEAQNVLRKKQINLNSLRNRIEWKSLSRSSLFALSAANEALVQAGFLPDGSQNHSLSLEFDLAFNDRTGVVFGPGIEGISEVIQSSNSLSQHGYSSLGPYALLRSLTNMPAAHISRAWCLRGPSITVSTACATGMHCIGEAYHMIKHGYADVVVAGGTESCLDPWTFAAFSRMRALATDQDLGFLPHHISRPFDSRRNGFVMSEGAAALVLQAWPPPLHVQSRYSSITGTDVVNPLAEIVGYGRTSDAFGLVAPEPTGEGAYRCMKEALSEAKLSIHQVGHINCHATSTPLGDLIELVAIGRLLASATPDSFGPPLSIFVNSIKGHLGHCLGAAGAIEAAYTVLSVACGQIVACLNLESPPSNDHFTAALTNLVSTITSESWLRPFQEQAESSYPRINLLSAADDTGPSVAWPDEKRPRIALTNSFGFGGTNASLVISEFLPVGESASAK